ncbi:MAG: aminotransferase class I/II-fold pyridoxal phosphate-dependent enzyme [Candidatus Obscuribacterales bacterium]|nr:aminotransferase class I/II-fold pyridoxal phosphate-dependent enzyme [Candidatus Obscuribacterales bacterium]
MTTNKITEHLLIPDVLGNEKSVIEPLKKLLSELENLKTQRDAIRSLHELAQYVEANGHSVLAYKDVPVPQLDQKIRLLLHPAVFSPEYWGRTFAEGLIKQPEVYYGKRVVELGTGSGWISLLMLLKTGASQVLALDLNPVAVLIAQLNKWLNGTTIDGALINSQFGVPIVQALTIAESDLLRVAVDDNLKFDHVIGCIPQVLHPDPDNLKSEKGEGQQSESDLYDLSNYCFQQGILEDRYGLPLIARALEESQLCMLPGGTVTLILGGRPGQEAIESVFHRRGYKTELAWSRRIPQADDTDLASLVKLEKAYGIQFHFFIARNSSQSVSADTAVSLLAEGKPVFHDLLVYKAKTNFEKPTFAVVSDVHSLGLDSLRRELDFSITTEEQISFLSKLTSELRKYKTIPYPHERGDLSIRERLTKFLAVYCHYHVERDELFIGPERAQLISLVLKMVLEKGQAVLLSNSLFSVYGPYIEINSKVIKGNDDLNELLLLDDWLAPKIILIAPQQLEAASPMLLKAIIDQALKHPERTYIIDDSAHFDICSSLQANIFLRLAAQQQLPGNLIFVYGLIKSTVAPDLELSFLLNAPSDWVHSLEIGAELTYSRISYISQLYYEWLFDELLAFPFDESAVCSPSPAIKTLPVISESFKKIAEDVSFAAKPIEVDEDVIRLDYGELAFSVPNILVEGLIKGFLEPRAQDLKPLVKRRVVDYMRITRGASITDAERVVLAQGVFPLFGSLLRVLTERLGRPPVVAVPQGTYGLIYPLIAYHGAILQVVPTTAESRFLVSEYALADLEAEAKQKPDLLWLTQPANPSGFFMEPLQITALMDYCEQRQIYILADEIFFLLSDIAMGEQTPHDLSFAQFLCSSASRYLFLTDGLSKAFAAGGLRVGEMVCPDAAFAADISKLLPAPPQSVLRACDSLYSLYSVPSDDEFECARGASASQVLNNYLHETRALISAQRESILKLLRKHKVDDGVRDGFRGGFFNVAKLAQSCTRLATAEKVLVNPDDWSRTAGWVRVCCGLTTAKFEQGYARLSNFLERG